MHLNGREGNELGLTLIGYQFPENTTDPWDSNQLLVAVHITSRQGTWQVHDPCLTTWEAKSLATWLLRATAIGTALGRATFSEPNVTMTATRSGLPGWFEVGAELELEERPPWAPEGGALRVELAVEEPQLLKAARELLNELREFPQRGDDPTL
ncbi:MAG TPA: hypothetical protein VM121_00905 [Acidimicrobiales bacterium]|nr:hypothetical protein [Acidimicrobiales bacterium]